MDDDLIIAIGSRGRGKGEFTNPQGVAVTNAGDILVCDSNSQCVQVLQTVILASLINKSLLQVFSPTGAVLCSYTSNIRQIVL
jgi:hypothetical protein